MRAVRHRAVAQEAGVSLGSTTYHFKSIDDLIASTFVYWMQRDDDNRADELASIQAVLEQSQELNKAELHKALINAACEYLHTQIVLNRDDRFIEMAFHNEATRNEQLSELILNSWREDAKRLSQFYAVLGATNPELAGQDTHALILQLERRSLLFQQKQLAKEFDQMSQTLAYHLEKVLKH